MFDAGRGGRETKEEEKEEKKSTIYFIRFFVLLCTRPLYTMARS